MSQKKYDTEWLAQVARAACLNLDGEDLSRLASEIGRELSELSELRTENREDWQKDAVELSSLRPDQTGNCLSRDGLLLSATHQRDGCFLVPDVFGEGGGT